MFCRFFSIELLLPDPLALAPVDEPNASDEGGATSERSRYCSASDVARVMSDPGAGGSATFSKGVYGSVGGGGEATGVGSSGGAGDDAGAVGGVAIGCLSAAAGNGFDGFVARKRASDVVVTAASGAEARSSGRRSATRLAAASIIAVPRFFGRRAAGESGGRGVGRTRVDAGVSVGQESVESVKCWEWLKGDSARRQKAIGCRRSLPFSTTHHPLIPNSHTMASAGFFSGGGFSDDTKVRGPDPGLQARADPGAESGALHQERRDGQGSSTPIVPASRG